MQKPFTWHISYAGTNDYEKELAPGDHDNYNCACVPHDMDIRLPVSKQDMFLLMIIQYLHLILKDGFYCYHYMNCLNENEYMIEVTDWAIYINVGQETVDMCIL